MAKRDIVTSVASITAAVATWREIGREFRRGDEAYGEVGLVTTLGRIAIKVTASTLAYALTDGAFEWIFKAKDQIVEGVKERQEEKEEEEELEEEEFEETVEVEEDE